ncbi:MAG TPA: CBS domain-containing protein [Lachnospiraceae bacterium]|jgi:CBS domain-containing protein|nr:CBS domain-containing protein [Lachnospiraceae bacterium]
MNILFLMTPKMDVDCVFENDTVGQALHRLEVHEFTTVPLINDATGKYVGSLSEGDLLRELMRQNASPAMVEDRPISGIHRKRDYTPVRADADISELFQYAKTQNFVPVVDDGGVFIGIVTRQSILQPCIQAYRENKERKSSRSVVMTGTYQ